MLFLPVVGSSVVVLYQLLSTCRSPASPWHRHGRARLTGHRWQSGLRVSRADGQSVGKYVTFWGWVLTYIMCLSIWEPGFASSQVKPAGRALSPPESRRTYEQGTDKEKEKAALHVLPTRAAVAGNQWV